MKAYLTILIFLISPFISFAKVIVISEPSIDSFFWSMLKKGQLIAQQQTNIKDIEYRVTKTNNIIELSRLIDVSITAKPKAIILSITNEKSLAYVIKRALKSGVMIVAINNSVDYKKLGIGLYIGNSNYNTAIKIGEKFNTLGLNKVVCINHNNQDIGLNQKCSGIQKGLKKELSILSLNNLEEFEIQDKIESYIKNSKPDGIITLSAVNGSRVLNILKAQKLNQKTKLITFANNYNIAKGIIDGDIEFAVDEKPFLQGYLSIILIDNYLKTKMLPSNYINIEPEFIYKNNMQDIKSLVGKYR